MRTQHAPVVPALERLIWEEPGARRARPEVSAAWPVSATIALGHAAGADIAERMASTEAAAALRDSILCVYGRRS